ncbi:MAG: hypothetical protein RLY78_1856, partial [Pseudomonadota bacterium]
SFGYAWRQIGGDKQAARQGLALQWWLGQLEREATRHALIERHGAQWLTME